MKLAVRRAACILLAALCVLPCSPVAALVVVPPSTNDNTSAPADDPGWLNVGNRGIYLGNRWVLTAFHVGAGTTTFPNVGTFSAVSGSEVRVPNPTGQTLSTFTDLLLFRLASDPGLPPLTLSSATPAVGSSLTLIGDGGAVNSTPPTMETHWIVTDDGSGGFTWTETPTGGDAHGYKSTTARKLWGTNVVEDDEAIFDDMDADHTIVASTSPANGDVISFFTDFDDPNDPGDPNDPFDEATPSEAQALSSDSGSAVFVKEGANWVLAGVTHAILLFEDQPDVGFTAVYGNLTLAADLAAYRNQILAITAIPEVSSFVLLTAVGAVLASRRMGFI